MTQRVWVPGSDKPAYFPDEMSSADIDAAVRQHLGVKQPVAAKAQPKQADLPEGIAANIPGALRETFGGGDRPGAVPLTGRPGFETPAGVWAKPGQNVSDPTLKAAEHIASGMIDMAPLGKAATIPRQMLMAGALGGTKAVARGESTGASVGDSLVDAAIAGVTGGGMKLATKVGREKWGVPSLQALGSRVVGFERGEQKIRQAGEAVAEQLPLDSKPWLEVPSLGKGKLRFSEAIEKLIALRGEAFEVARRELVGRLNQVSRQLEKAGIKPKAPLAAGTRFGLTAPDFRRAPTGGERFAKSATDVLRDPIARAAATAATTGAASGYEGDVGLVGAGLAGEAGGSFGELAHAVKQVTQR